MHCLCEELNLENPQTINPFRATGPTGPFLAAQLFILIHSLMCFCFFNLEFCFGCSLCRTRCELYMAIMIRS